MSKINCEHEWGITPDQGRCCKKCGTLESMERHQCNVTKSLDVIHRFGYDTGQRPKPDRLDYAHAKGYMEALEGPEIEFLLNQIREVEEWLSSQPGSTEFLMQKKLAPLRMESEADAFKARVERYEKAFREIARYVHVGITREGPRESLARIGGIVEEALAPPVGEKEI